MFRRFLVLSIVLLTLGACTNFADSFFGLAETEEQMAYRKAGEYVYVTIPAVNYVNHEKALVTTTKIICAIDDSAFAAVNTAQKAFMSGADNKTVVLLEAASALASFNLEIFNELTIPDAGDALERTVVLTTVGLESAGAMRLWRKQFLQVKLEAMVASGRAPTEAEWLQVDNKMAEQHKAVQAKCEV